MTQSSVKEILGKIATLKNQSSLQIIDSHIHSHDVMGVVHYSHMAKGEVGLEQKDYLRPGILEYFNYNKLEKLGSRIAFRLFPNLIDL